MSDFVTTYADYADVYEAPRMFHEAAAVLMVASILNHNRVTFHNSSVHYPLDFWLLLLSPSGMGRSLLQDLAHSVLPASLETPMQWGSPIAMQQQLALNPYALWFWGEFGEILARLNTGRFATAKEWLADLFDRFRVPPRVVYRSRRRADGSDPGTPPIEFDEAPRVNIFAVSSDDWFFTHLDATDTAGGFLGRFSPLRVTDAGRDISSPGELDATLLSTLKAQASQIDSLRGEADINGILPLYDRWYRVTKRRFRSQPNSRLAMAFFNRHRGTVLKLAVIFQASEFGTLTVSKVAWKRAARFATRIEAAIFSLLPTGMNAQGHELQKSEELIRQAGPKGLSQNEFTRATQHLKYKERMEILATLRDGGRIELRNVARNSNGGRPKTVLFHTDHRQGATP